MKQTDKSLFPFYKEIPLKEREEWREYRFPGGELVRIEKPQYLIVSDNGHRLLDGDGRSHYVPYGWIHLCWENKGDHEFYCKNPDKEPEK